MIRPDRPRRRRPAPKGILAGADEAIFSVLPQEVLAQMRRAGSESAVVWDTFYPTAHAGISLLAWTAIRPLWGTAVEPQDDDVLIPYFWGRRVDGDTLPGLSTAAEVVAGREDRLEVDLFLRGERHLIAVEAKTEGEPGRCSRYEAGRCPEVHGGSEPCRYWEAPTRFGDSLDFGERPSPADGVCPPCAVHYQLGRSLLLVQFLARSSDLIPHLHLVVPRRRWTARRAGWLDFAERVREDEMWRRLRVLAWEDIIAANLAV